MTRAILSKEFEAEAIARLKSGGGVNRKGWNINALNKANNRSVSRRRIRGALS
ncbi:MAG: hypothetical protein V4471_05330 [Pseudomonadota bacterium]